MDPLQLFSLVLVAAGIFVLAVGISGARSQKAGPLAELYGEPAGTPDSAWEPLADRLMVPAKRRFGDLGRRFTPKGQLEKMRRHATLAGMGSGGVESILAFKAAGTAVGAALIPLSMMAVGADFGNVLLFALAGGALGFVAPDAWIARRGNKRQTEIRRNLPESIDLLAIAVQAGMGLEAGIELVSQSVPGALGEELYRLLQEIQLGSSRRQALQQLRDRTEVDELSTFALALIQADSIGSPIADVLQANAARMRMVRRQDARETAAKLPVKLLFPMLFLIFPALMIIIVGPAALSIAGKLSL